VIFPKLKEPVRKPQGLMISGELRLEIAALIPEDMWFSHWILQRTDYITMSQTL
jgi:hypothetical protein